MPPQYKDLSGKKFGKLTAISRGDDKLWNCVCECGGARKVPSGNLNNGHARHCGCERRIRAMIDGWSGTPEYKAWWAARERCMNPSVDCYKHYGGRGIRMCKLWADDFFEFLKHIGPRPSPKLSLDRFPDKNGDYEPGNVRWATTPQQNRNRNGLTSVEWKGKEYTITELALLVKLPRYVLNERLRHEWGIEDAVNTPYVPTSRKGIPKHNRFITHGGVTRTITEWGNLTGFSAFTIHRRLKAGWSIKLALTAPLNSRQMTQYK